VDLPKLWDDPKAKPAAKAKAGPTLPVTAEQVTESNAREKAEALRHELDRDTPPAPAKAVP
jgi:hypothetical protein